MRNDCKLRDANIKFTEQTCKYEPRNAHRQKKRVDQVLQKNKERRKKSQTQRNPNITSGSGNKKKMEACMYVPHHARSSSVEGLLRSLTNFCHSASFFTLTCAADWLPRSHANHRPCFESGPIIDNRDILTWALRQYPALIFYTQTIWFLHIPTVLLSQSTGMLMAAWRWGNANA